MTYGRIFMPTAAPKLEINSYQQSEHRHVPALAVPGATTTPAITPASPGSEERFLAALSRPSLTNVILAGFIRDNGFVNPLNRGRFYNCLNEKHEVEGVALIGHTILFEAFSERAIQAFAALARRENSPHLLMGEHNAVERFWSYYSSNDESPRLVCPITFLQRRERFPEQTELPGLRPATREDLEPVVQAQAAMACEISGVDPLKKDPAGFRERYLRRIEMKRVWVVIENGQLIFKTDIIADTPQAIYIEGVYVRPADRGKGVGHRCVTALGRILLKRSKAIYLFVENENTPTQSFYLNLGFTPAGQYDLLYF
jgi:ribosomal protein S18 acetylase RimI-like enzyme